MIHEHNMIFFFHSIRCVSYDNNNNARDLIAMCVKQKLELQQWLISYVRKTKAKTPTIPGVKRREEGPQFDDDKYARGRK